MSTYMMTFLNLIFIPILSILNITRDCPPTAAVYSTATAAQSQILHIYLNYLRFWIQPFLSPSYMHGNVRLCHFYICKKGFRDMISNKYFDFWKWSIIWINIFYLNLLLSVLFFSYHYIPLNWTLIFFIISMWKFKFYTNSCVCIKRAFRICFGKTLLTFWSGPEIEL